MSTFIVLICLYLHYFWSALYLICTTRDIHSFLYDLFWSALPDMQYSWCALMLICTCSSRLHDLLALRLHPMSHTVLIVHGHPILCHMLYWTSIVSLFMAWYLFPVGLSTGSWCCMACTLCHKLECGWRFKRHGFDTYHIPMWHTIYVLGYMFRCMSQYTPLYYKQKPF